MEDLRTRPLTRGQISDFIKSERGVRSYEGMQYDLISQNDAITAASFLVVNSEPTLGSERALTIGAGLSGVDGGPNGPYTLTNTAPDLVVTIAGAGTTVVTGSYPNFTITSNDQYDGTVTSVDASGGSTGLSFSGGPITTAGTLTLGGNLVAASGGTGQSSYTVGDILYASGATALSKLASVVTGNVLLSGGVAGAPVYGKVGLTTHVSGVLPLANGGALSGVYTPTLTNVANIDASTPHECYWQRIGNYVHVFGAVDIDPTTASSGITLGISLPVASAFTSQYDLSGHVIGLPSGYTQAAGVLRADATNDRAQAEFVAQVNFNTAYTISFGYRVI